MPACWSLGCQGPARGEEAEPRDRAFGAFCSARQQAHGAGPPCPSATVLQAGEGFSARSGPPASLSWTLPPLFRGPVPSDLHSPEPLHVESWVCCFTWFVVCSRTLDPIAGPRVTGDVFGPHLLPFLLVDCLGHTWLPLGSSGSESLNRSLSEVQSLQNLESRGQCPRSP